MASARPVLSLIRPIATSRPAAILQIHRFSQCAHLRQEAEITTASTTAPVDANAPAVEQVRPPILPYFVQRTPSNNLPVYNAQKRGGNRKETKLRKISGDVKALQSELRAYLDIPEHDITINPTTGHIIAKGDHYMKIVEFLKSKQF